MQFETIENYLLSVVNPLLKFLMNHFDEECPKDGNLLQNSLRQFLGEPIILCSRCSHIYRKSMKPFYKVGSHLLRVNEGFMKTQFRDEYHEAWLKGFSLMMKGIKDYGIRIPFTPAGPFEIVWNLTYQCNLECKHCYENAGDRKRPEMSTAEAMQTLDVLSKIANVGLPALSFSGGEPLARKDFYELARYAKKRIPYVSIASNGTLITRDNAKRIKDAGVDYVEISVDGATPQTHDKFRGIPGSFERAIQGVKNCIEEGIDTCLATVIHKDNYSETEEIISLANKLNTRLMHFNYVPTGRAKEHVELDLTPEQRFNVLQAIGKQIITLYLQAKEEELKFGKTNIIVDRFFSTCPQYACVTKELSQQKGQKFIVEAHYGAKKGVENVANFLGGCGAGRLYCALEPNGDLKPCVFLPTNRDTIIGNVLRDDFGEVWTNTPLLWKLRTREHLETHIVNDRRVGCGDCPDKYICGGCRARAYAYFNGDINAPDIGCLRNKALWERPVRSRLRT